MGLNIVGISALFHDAGCCLLKDGQLAAAAQEERFSRIKHDQRMPYHAFQYCLEAANLRLTDIDAIAYYELPDKKLERQLYSGLQATSEEAMLALSPDRVNRQIKEMLGFEGPIHFVPHHLSHAASSFYYSGFDEAAILVADGVGEWATTSYGVGKGCKIDLFEEVHFPHSLGLLYSTLTSYLGFRVNNGEYKVMGLAPYGKPIYKDQVRQLIEVREKGQFALNMEYFAFVDTNSMYSDRLVDLFGAPPREPESEFSQVYLNIAKSIQVVLEEILIEKAHYLHEATQQENLCMAGGVALNCVANGKILQQSPFQQMFVQPASNDSGGALGAAAYTHQELTGERVQTERLSDAYWGPSFTPAEVKKALSGTGIVVNEYVDDLPGLLKHTAQVLADGKVVGWFQGRMEFGPRALGARSIIANPMIEDMRDRVNALVKKREGFRPFAPAILLEKAQEHFDLDHESPFMLETCQVVSDLHLPAITHVDNSARVQTVSEQSNERFQQLLQHFDALTGCPILLNTSFNVRGEPIVCTPEDALKCFVKTQIDYLVVGDYLIAREDNDLDTLATLLNAFEQPRASAIRHDVYTFM